MNGKLLAAIFATLALAAVTLAAPAEQKAAVAADARFREAVKETDAAFRTAALAEVDALASIAKGAISGGNGGGFSIWSILDFTGLFRKLFGHKSSGGAAGNAIAQAENLLRVRRSPDGGSDGGNKGGDSNGNNGGSDGGNKGGDSNGSSSAGASSCGSGLIAMIKKLFGMCSSGSASSSKGSNGGNN